MGGRWKQTTPDGVEKYAAAGKSRQCVLPAGRIGEAQYAPVALRIEGTLIVPL